jgi:uridine kinase
MRKQLIADIADAISRIKKPHPVRVAFDGIPAAGKTTLADEVAAELVEQDIQVIRGTIDGFHNPPEIRRKKGNLCPDGYYEDSFDFTAIKNMVLKPLGPSGSRRYRIAAYDYRTESPVDSPETEAGEDAVLIFDGVFLQRPEILEHWDLRVFVQISFDESIRRAMSRDMEYFGNSETLMDKHRLRYIPGHKRYFEEADPQGNAHITVENEVPHAPKIAFAPRHSIDSPQQMRVSPEALSAIANE